MSDRVYLGSLLAANDSLRAELAEYRADLKAAADELLVELPKPGTDAARMLIANRLLKAECAILRKALAFAASTIKCGESWTSVCEEIIGNALRGKP